MNTTMANHPQQQFGQGLGNNGDRPPNEKQNDVPQRGHNAESLRPTDMLIVFQDAGVRKHHTVCITCGQQADLSHRSQWRECRGGCFLDPTHDHPGQPCPDLMRVANEDWCFAHVRELLSAERDAALDPEHQQRPTQRREQRINAPKPSSNRPPQQYGRPALHMGSPQGNWMASMPSSRHFGNQRLTHGELFGDYQELDHHAGHPNSSYGAEYEIFGDRGSSADLTPVYDGKHPTQSGTTRRPDFRERSPLRMSFPSRSSYRDRAPSTVPPARQTPTATERMVELRAQRLAERESSSAPVGQSPTLPTPAQSAQSQVQSDLERKFQEQEQRLQAAMTAITTLRQEASAADTRYEQLMRIHVTLKQQLSEALRNAATPAHTPAQRAHNETTAEPPRSKAEQPLPNQIAGHQSNDMLSSQEAELLQSAPGLGQQMASIGLWERYLHGK